MLFGSTTYNKVSRFVNEIPDNLIVRTGEEKKFATSFSSSGSVAVGTTAKPSYTPSSFGGYKKPAIQSGTVYNVGDCVLHKVFGKGMVVNTEKMGNDTLLEISFDKAGTKKLMANFSKMEKI